MAGTSVATEVRSADLILVRDALGAKLDTIHREAHKAHGDLAEACEDRLAEGESTADLITALAGVTAVIVSLTGLRNQLTTLEETAWQLGRRQGRQDVRS